MALKIDDIMDLSLDDYIAMSKSANIDDTGNKSHEKRTFNGNNDVKFGRRKGNIDDEDEDEDDFLMQTAKELEEIDVKKRGSDIWKGPDSSICYLDCNGHRNDLREKLDNNGNKTIPKFSSIQYRMLAPNNAANRPRGIPTLLPLDAPVNKGDGLPNRGNKRYGRNRGYNAKRNFNNAKNDAFNSQTGYGGNGVASGRVQRNRKQDIGNKNFRFSVAKNNGNNPNSFLNTYTSAQNMLIETPSSCINLAPSTRLNSSFQMPQHVPRPINSSQSLPIGNLTPQAEAVLNLNSLRVQNNSLAAGSSNESLKSLLGFQGNVSSETFASRLMEFIEGGMQNTVHKPIYDMKIQTDIHEIQKKPLLYKCPGGDVVSSDGAGVNCKIIPRTSGVSLNCRFS